MPYCMPIVNGRSFIRDFIKLFAALMLLFSCIANCAAQNTSVRPGTDTALIIRLIDSGLKEGDAIVAMRIFEKPLQLSIAGDYTFGILRSLNSISKIYIRKNDFDSVIFTYNKAISYCKLPVERAWFLTAMGDQYMRHSDLTKCSEKYFAALDELKNNTINDRRSITAYLGIYAGLAQVYLYLGEDKNEYFYFNAAETLARKTREYYHLQVILSNKAGYFIQHKDLDSAGILYREAATIIKDHNFRDSESDIDLAMGWYHIYNKEFEKALRYFKDAVGSHALPFNLRPDRVKMMSDYGISDALHRLGRNKEAEAILLPAIGNANKQNMRESILTAYQILNNIYRATGRYKKAVECMDTMMVINDSLTGTEKTATIARMEAKYQLTEKDRQLSVSKLLIAQQKTKISQRNLWVVVISAILIVTLLIASGILLNVRNKQRALAHENKIRILKATINGGDDERSRIARELHDGIGGMLSAAMMRFSSLHHESPEVTNTRAYNDGMDILKEMGNEIRKTAHNLMPEVLMKQSLPEAMQAVCNNVQERDNMQVKFQSYGSSENLSQSCKLNLYRIVQELVRNAVMHSGAQVISVQYLQTGNKLIVSVEDNGCGFKINEVKGGLGLHNINTRAQSLDSQLIIESEPGKGTTVIVEIELPEVEAIAATQTTHEKSELLNTN